MIASDRLLSRKLSCVATLWTHALHHALPHYGHTHFHSCGLDNIDRCSRPDLFATWHISTPGIQTLPISLLGYGTLQAHSWNFSYFIVRRLFSFIVLRLLTFIVLRLLTFIVRWTLNFYSPMDSYHGHKTLFVVRRLFSWSVDSSSVDLIVAGQRLLGFDSSKLSSTARLTPGLSSSTSSSMARLTPGLYSSTSLSMARLTPGLFSSTSSSMARLTPGLYSSTSPSMASVRWT